MVGVAITRASLHLLYLVLLYDIESIVAEIATLELALMDGIVIGQFKKSMRIS